MPRNWLLAAGLLLGTSAAPAAQPGYPPYPFPNPPLPTPAQPPAGIEGRWFYAGNPFQPCYVQVFNGPRGPELLFTNEKGEQSRGGVLRNGVIAYDWQGGLFGQLRGDTLLWQNATFWTR